MLIELFGAPTLVGRRDRAGLRGRRQAALLSVLALHTGRPVRRDVLEEEIWGGRHVSEAAVRVAVNRLRTRFDAVIAEDPIRAVPGGYQLVCTPDDVDVARFRTIAADALDANRRGHIERAAEGARRADALWRGAPFSGVDDVPILQSEAAHLTAVRAELDEVRGAALVALGDASGAAEVLARTVAADPYRERAWGLLMVALYRAGRQAEALGAYARMRTLLEQELGLRPGGPLVALEQAIIEGRAPDEVGSALLSPTDTMDRVGVIGRRRPATVDDAVAALVGGDGEPLPRRVRRILESDGPAAALADLEPRPPSAVVHALAATVLAVMGRSTEARDRLVEADAAASASVDDGIQVALARAAVDRRLLLADSQRVELLIASAPADAPGILELRTALAEAYAFSGRPDRVDTHLDVVFADLGRLDYGWSARAHLIRRDRLAMAGNRGDEAAHLWASVSDLAGRARTDCQRMPLQRAVLGDLYQSGDLDRYDEVLDQYREAADRADSITDRWCALAMVAAGDLLRAPFEAMAESAEAARAYGTAHGVTTADETADAQLVIGLLLHDQIGAAAATVDERTRGDSAVAWRAAAAVALAHAGDEEGASAALDLLRGPGFSHLDRDWLRRPALAMAANAVHLLDDVGLAAELLPELHAFGVTTVVLGNSIANLGPTDRYLGLLYATVGDPARAAHHLARAEELARRMGAPVLVDLAHRDRVVVDEATAAPALRRAQLG